MRRLISNVEIERAGEETTVDSNFILVQARAPANTPGAAVDPQAA